jgi:hypothetical protein
MQIFTVTARDLKTTIVHESADSSTISNNSQIQTVTSPLSGYVNFEAIFGFNISKAQLHFSLYKCTFCTAQRTYSVFILIMSSFTL